MARQVSGTAWLGKLPSLPIAGTGFVLTANAYREGMTSEWVVIAGPDKDAVIRTAIDTIMKAIMEAGLPAPLPPTTHALGERSISIVVARVVYDALALWWENAGLNDIDLATYLAKTFRGVDAELVKEPT